MEAILNNLIKAIGWSLFHSLWQGAIVYALLFILMASLPKINAKIKHNLAFFSLILLFLSFCITFISVFKWPQEIPSSSQIFNLTRVINQQPASLLTSISSSTEQFFPLLVSIYLVGIFGQLLVFVGGYQKINKLKKANNTAVPKAWQNIFETVLLQLGLRKKVNFHLSALVNVPLVIGYFKPIILFPIALATQLNEQQVEAILIHELSHIRRNDYLLNLVKTAIETLLFFNPFVWLTSKFISIEREHACDDLVLKFTGTPLTYAHALLKLELIKNKQAPLFAMAASGKNQHLYQRIKRITNMKTNYINAKQQFLILTVTLATIASLAWISPTKKEVIAVKKAKNLSSVIALAKEGKPKTKAIAFTADTDSVKVTKPFRMVTRDKKGKEIVYNSFAEVPDSLKKKMVEMQKKFNSPEWKANIAKMQENAIVMEKKFNSPEWKEKMAKVEENAKSMEKKFNSPEWKEKMAKVEENAKAIEKKFNSPEWKANIAKMEENAKVMERNFNSPEWSANIAKMEENAKAIEKKFNSPEWKEKMAKMKENAKAIEKKFSSPEWKANIAKMEENAKAMERNFNSPEFKANIAKIEENAKIMERNFNSPEFKANIAKIEENAKAMEKKFNSPEWKEKMIELEQLQALPEFKELNKKYNQDLENLKKLRLNNLNKLQKPDLKLQKTDLKLQKSDSLNKSNKTGKLNEDLYIDVNGVKVNTNSTTAKRAYKKLDASNDSLFVKNKEFSKYLINEMEYNAKARIYIDRAKNRSIDRPRSSILTENR